MNAVKKRKIRKWIKEHKALVIGGGLFALLGLIGLIIGFEIANDWHAIRDWINSPTALTFFICLGIGVLALIFVIILFVNLKRGDE